MPLNQQPLNRSPPPLVARRNSKQHIREFVVQYGRRRVLCEREEREDKAVSIHDAVMDAICSQPCFTRAIADETHHREGHPGGAEGRGEAQV